MPFGIEKVLDHYDIVYFITVWPWRRRKAVGGIVWMNESVNELITRLFIEQRPGLLNT